MRAANLFLFLGTVGFINIYEEMTSDDESGTGKLDPSDAKRLQRKFGVKEKRSANIGDRQAAATAAGAAAAIAARPINFVDYAEVQLVEHLKRPVYRGLTGCASADGTACNCLRLLCFGQAECAVPAAAATPNQANAKQPPVGPADPRYVYYATGARLQARRRPLSLASIEAATYQDRLLRCRQTTIDPYVLCECKIYARNTA